MFRALIKSNLPKDQVFAVTVGASSKTHAGQLAPPRPIRRHREYRRLEPAEV